WRALSAEERRTLEGGLPSARWFPGALHERLVEALDDASAGDAALRRAGGRHAADRLLADAEARGIASWVGPGRGWERAGPLLVAVPSRLLSETSWRLLPGDEAGRFTAEVSGAEALSEPSRRAAEALLEGLAARLAGVDVAVRSERPEPGVVRFVGRPRRLRGHAAPARD
ncbi:MAG: hypothetical protein R3263_02065, partial [Myxococcota bacterium]|nr:hypothetical protein [Myxococcota bacterium]